MRLWHIDLIPVLPNNQLSGQWKELGSIYKNQNRHLLIKENYQIWSKVEAYKADKIKLIKKRLDEWDATHAA